MHSGLLQWTAWWKRTRLFSFIKVMDEIKERKGGGKRQINTNLGVGRNGGKMQTNCVRDASQACFHGCSSIPFLGQREPQTPNSITSAAASRYDFEVAMVSSIRPNSQFTNHESLPSLHESFSNFIKAFPQYSQTDQADKIREQEYYHLSLANHVCLDYFGHGLFSYLQQQSHWRVSTASTSSSPPLLHSTALEPPFFDVSCKSVNLYSQIEYSGQESELEFKIQKRIMAFMNLSEDDYKVVFTANQSSAFKLLADSYPFQSNQNLLTVYDHECEAVKKMIESSEKKGARIMSAEFSWPTLRIQTGKLRKSVMSKRKKTKKGLFVFPLYSRMTGARYSYIWMNLAQENGWHVVLDACALGPKYMETLGLSLFKPDFIICSFFNVFGENPSGFGCLFVKKSSASVLKDSNTTASIGIVRLVPPMKPSQLSEESAIADTEVEPEEKLVEMHSDVILQGSSSCSDPIANWQMSDEISELHESEKISEKRKTEIEEFVAPFENIESKIIESKVSGNSELECRGLDHADSLGLILISARARYLINWLVNALMSLQHPHSENGLPPVRIYGPKIRFDRGPAVAFNIFDWKGEKIDPELVQKLADRNNISLSCGFLQNIWFSDKYEGEREWILETRTSRGGTVIDKGHKMQAGISMVTAALGLLTNFEDTYRLWAFVSRFLDADFVEKERWRYTALNQKTIEV